MTSAPTRHSTADLPDKRVSGWITKIMPDHVTPLVRNLAIASLVTQTLIVITGAAVRLTGSGLGCPTWPRCTAESFVNTPEMGIHGIIEFGNRLLTFVLAIVAIAMLVSVWRMRRRQPLVFWLSVGLLCGIPAQAVIGGITVLTQLNPWVVSGHLLVSLVLISLATILVKRTSRLLTAERGLSRPASGASRTLVQLCIAQAIFAGIAAFLGTVVTGTGPHSGDHGAARHNFDPDFVTRLHVVPVYLLVFALIAATVIAYRERGISTRLKTALWLGIAVTFLQAVIGYTQHYTGLPVLLVGAHMLGACLTISAATNIVDEARARPVVPAAGAQSRKPQQPATV